MQLLKYEEGGPNDPNVTFNGLRTQLTQVKEELSPWAWKAYSADFRDRQKAEKKLQALNRLPGSGVEPKDNILQGTPLWQERLDTMMLVEHLKTKLMTAHTVFSDATELLLKSHVWLVKEPLLSDRFVNCITHVPPSQFERIDVLQDKIVAQKRELDDLRNEYEDFQITLQRNREAFLQRTEDNQDISLPRRLSDDVVLAWSYRAQREQVLRLTEVREVLQARVASLEAAYAAKSEDFEESLRQWDEERQALTLDRDKYKKLYNKMMRAHEQAMEDLKETQGTAEGQVKMIQTLSVEKSRLTDQVEQLEDDKKRLSKQLADARDEIAKLRQEVRRLGQQMRGSETALVNTRHRVGVLEGVERALGGRLDESAAREARLMDDLAVSRCETDAARAGARELRAELAGEAELRGSVEDERDSFMGSLRDLERRYVQTVENAHNTVQALKEKAARELEEFKTTELARVKEEFRVKTDKIKQRNELLEREVALSENLGPHLATLNPLSMDDSRLCSVCKRTIVFEGPVLPRK
mmetsp:Transcript_110438/g.312365  ORF Transcript_110438/g.312365 Transcript_110438/m.312365 type:complete len:527 (+) Transcript_110438:108-1688(+)